MFKCEREVRIGVPNSGWHLSRVGELPAVAAVRLGNVAQYLLDVLTAALVGGLVTFVTENLDAHTP